MKYCEECGAAMEDDEIYCSECGAKAEHLLDEQSETTQTEDTKPINNNDNYTVKHKNGKLYIMIGVLLTVIVAVGLALILFFVGKKDENDTLDMDTSENHTVDMETEIENTSDEIVTEESTTEEPTTEEPTTEEPTTEEPTTEESTTEKPTTEEQLNWVGEYLDDDGYVKIEESGTEYHIEISIFRLTSIDDGVGTIEGNKIAFTATDDNGEPIGGEIEKTDNGVDVIFTDSTWTYIKNGDRFSYRSK